ncbi:transposase [Streptomyces pseudogriseolus]|uniref:transposase n=1 Tax=Streptomyces pseudogriseolus TaxID=36817 RepID=UPI0035ABEB4D
MGVGRPARRRRCLIDGVRWRVRTGAPWRGLPVEHGRWLHAPGRCGRADHAGGERRLDDLSCPSACCRCPPGRSRAT